MGILIEQLESRRMMAASREIADLKAMRADWSVAIHPISMPVIDILSRAPDYITSPDGRISATFVRFRGALQLKEYSAVVDWGDGTTSQAELSRENDGTVSVVASHFYTAGGVHNASFEINAPGGWREFNGVTIFSHVSAMASLGSPDIDVYPHDERPGGIGWFLDPSPAGASAYSAIVDWGDGTVSTATVGRDGTNPTYWIGGGHDYAQSGHYVVSITVTKIDQSGYVADTLRIDGDANIRVASNRGIEAQRSLIVDGLVAVLDGRYSGTQLFADIEWDDGSFSSASFDRLPDGRWGVFGQHEYERPGGHVIWVEWWDEETGDQGHSFCQKIVGADSMVDLQSGLLLSAASIRDNWLPPSETPLRYALGSFFDLDPLPSAAYQVVIDWGDGTTTRGRAVSRGGGFFNVEGWHGYPLVGGYSVSVTVSKTAESNRVVQSLTLGLRIEVCNESPWQLWFESNSVTTTEPKQKPPTSVEAEATPRSAPPTIEYWSKRYSADNPWCTSLSGAEAPSSDDILSATEAS